MLARFAVVVATLVVAHPFVRAQEATPPPLTLQECRRLIDKQWTPSETFAWIRICLGEEADFNDDPQFGGKLDAKDPRGLPDSRKLSPTFLRSILQTDKYRRALTSRGVRINGARFTIPVDLTNLEIRHELWLDNSLFEKGADLTGLRSTRRITFDGAKVLSALTMREMHVEGLYIRESAELESVDLQDAHIDTYLNLTNSKIARSLNMSSVRVGGHVILDDVTVSELLDMSWLDVGGYVSMKSVEANQADLTDANLHRDLRLNDSKVTAGIRMDRMRLAGNMWAEKAAFGTLDLIDGHIGGWLSLLGTRIAGKADLDSVQVGSYVFMNGAVEFNQLNFANANIHATLFMSDSKINNVKMDGIHVGGNIVLEKANLSEVALPNARIGGFLSFRAATVLGAVDMELLQLGGYLLMDEGATFGNVNLLNANLQGNLSVSNSVVTSALNMDKIQIGGILSMNNSQLSDVISPRAQIKDGVDFSNAKVTGAVNMTDVRVDGNLVAIASDFAGEFSILGARIGNQLNFRKAKLKGTLDMERLQVGGYVFMDQDAEFADVDLTNAKLSADLFLNGARVAGALKMGGLHVGGSLVMRGNADFAADIILIGARIDGDIDLRGSKFNGGLFCDRLEVNQSIFMGDGAEFAGPLVFKTAKIRENIDWTDAVFGSNVDLGSAQIGQKFILSGKEAPKSILLSDFVFSVAEWGGDPTEVLRKLMAVTPPKEHYPGIYDRLAKSYADLGQSGVVRSVMIEKQNAEFKHASSFWEKGYLFVSWALAGYGYRPEIGLVWIGLFVIAGAIIFKTGAAHVKKGETVPDNWLVFAIDAVIPGIHLNSEYDKVKFSGWRQDFLYFLRFLGAVLIVLILQFLKQSVLGPR